jgi:ABC-type multidrug transport system permease subunit
VVDRLRTLPMARAAYLCGHVLAELAASMLGVTVLMLSGLIVGWGVHSDPLHALAGFALVLVFAFAMVWLGTLLGLVVRSPDAAQGIVFMLVFPMTFLASTFVPLGGLSPVLRAIASWNPISAVAAAVRELFGNPLGMPDDPAWPLRHAQLMAWGWALLILAIAVPLAIRRFRTRTAG